MEKKDISFVHLHTHTEFSLLDGASRMGKLCRRAKEMGMPALAITDHGVMYGVIDFYKEAKKQGIKPVLGCEVYVAPRSRTEKTAVDGETAYHLVLLAENEVGYRNLLELVSKAHIEGFYYKPRVDKEILRQHHQGLIALSGCIAGEIPQLILKGEPGAAEAVAKEYQEMFGADSFFLEIQDHGIPEQKVINPKVAALAERLHIGMVATNDIHYIDKGDAESHDVLLCIQTGKTVDDQGRLRFTGDEFYLKSGEEMDRLFSQYSGALENTLRIAERCNVELEFDKLHLPEFETPAGMTPEEYLYQICREQLPNRYPEITPQVEERLKYELEIINQMGFASYFLIVWDFVRFARSEKIAVGPGRGSAAGSIVSYLLAITNIDPLQYNLLFERFLNPERVTMPDIDIDFCYERRSKVIDYVSKRYGAERVAQIITFGTMAARAAIRDVGRALNMSYGDVDRIAKMVPMELGITLQKALTANQELQKAYQEEPEVKRLMDLAIAVEGMPRHASTHAAGLVISKEPLTHYVPLQNSSEGFVTTQYDKDRVEEIGLLKMDLLGLRTLTVISDTLELIRQNRGEELDIEGIPLADEATGLMLSKGDTAGVFQMESSGMTNLVKELKPERFDDLIPLVALYRPGPLGSGMVTDFIDGRHGRKKTTYSHPLMEPILSETFGVILYQEQVMQIASAMAGFSLGQADLLRRAMGKKKPEVIAAQRQDFLRGAEKRGIDAKIAEETFDLMAHFADYGFNKSHSAAYALVAYQTAYLKAHYPREFMAALLTSIMGDSNKIGYYIEECRRMGIPVQPPDVNASYASFSVDSQGIRFGLAGVKNVGTNAIQQIVTAREQDGRFTSLVDFCSRVDMRVVNKRVIESLIRGGALDSLGWHRAQLLHVLDRAVEVGAVRQKDAASGQMGLFGEEQLQVADDILPPEVPELPEGQRLAMEKEMTGFYITGHPLDQYREKMTKLIPVGSLREQCADGANVTIGGLIVTSKRIATRSGGMMCFLTLEDFTGSIEVVVFPRLFERIGNRLVLEAPVIVSGKVNISEETEKIIADDIRFMDLAAKEVRLTISPQHENEGISSQLRRIFQRHKGSSIVYMLFASTGRLIKTEEKYWIDPSGEAVAQLEQLLGKEAVVII